MSSKYAVKNVHKPTHPRHNPLDWDRVKTVPWSRLKGESKMRYKYFRAYRDFGSKRSLQRVADKFSRSRIVMERYSSQDFWTDRCLLWEEHQDKVLQDAHLSVIKGMADRHIRLSLLIQEKVIERLKTMSIEKLSTRELAQLTDIAVKIERQAFGEPDQIVHQSGERDIQNVYQDIKILAADPDTLKGAVERWEQVATGSRTSALKPGEHGAHPKSE